MLQFQLFLVELKQSSPEQHGIGLLVLSQSFPLQIQQNNYKVEKTNRTMVNLGKN